MTAPRRIWECKVHGHTGDEANCCVFFFGQDERACRMVEMQLASLDALVVEKENGEWPERVYVIGARAGETLDRLAKAQP